MARHEGTVYNNVQRFFQNTYEKCDELYDQIEMLIWKREDSGDEEFNYFYFNEMQEYLRKIQQECEEAKGF